jgi:pimeloyl-ACP methyl ester carboxylesterase
MVALRIVVRLSRPAGASPRTAIAALALLAAACATPTERFDRRAGALGFDAGVIEGEGFRHRIWTAGLDARDAPLHVYVEHDGTPWIEGSRVSADPTPRRPFALELMARDSGPRLLLGRPCHFAPAGETRCDALVWTHARYAPAVVGSMAAALARFLAAHPFRDVVIVGYSGGGTIAWLMAREVPEVSGVTTIAANLDTDEWTRIHGYSPLAGSLNPAREPPLPSRVAQRHLYGGRDANVTPAVVLSFASRHPEARAIEIAEFDHECCWIELLPQLLSRPTSQVTPR